MVRPRSARPDVLLDFSLSPTRFFRSPTPVRSPWERLWASLDQARTQAIGSLPTEPHELVEHRISGSPRGMEGASSETP